MKSLFNNFIIEYSISNNYDILMLPDNLEIMATNALSLFC